MRKPFKHNICFIALSVFSLTLSAQVSNEANIGDIYSASLKGDTKEYERTFFNLFPDTFIGFQKLYGYNEVKGASKYYKVALGHVNYFFKTAASVDEKIFVKKLLSISKNGRWKADAENYFQSNLRIYFFSHPSLLITLLKAKNQNDVKEFWYFFLDGPHFNKDVYTHTLLLLKGNSAMINLYQKAAERVKKDNKH